jgi:hypothetical protein
MPKIKGPKAFAISGVIRDMPEENSVGFSNFSESTAFGGVPDEGISSASELNDDELTQNYSFSPNFLRPSPDVIEEDLSFGVDLSINVAHDVSQFFSLIELL